MGEMFATSPSVFHFRIRTSFQVPGFEWVHELLLLCLTSNSAQFCAEIACGKTGLGHNCTDSRFRMKNDFLGLQAWGVSPYYLKLIAPRNGPEKGLLRTFVAESIKIPDSETQG